MNWLKFNASLFWAELRRLFVIGIGASFSKRIKSLKRFRHIHWTELHHEFQGRLNRNGALTFLAVGIVAYLLADTASLLVDFFLPEPPAVPMLASMPRFESPKAVDYQATILRRNIFSSQGIIPAEDLASMIPRKSNLPLRLSGCMIFEDENHSIATLEDSHSREIFTAQTGDTVLGSHRVVRIEPRKIFLQSLVSESLEYLEMQEDALAVELEILPQNGQKLSAIQKGGQEVRQVQPGEVEIDRAFFEKAMSNPTNILKQAMAVPYYENGAPNGFILVDVQAGGVFDKMGLKRDDIILSFNGESLAGSGNIVGKVTQLFQDLRGADRANITIRRQGQVIQQQFFVR